MSFSFHVAGHNFIGKTKPGSSRVHVYLENGGRFIGSYDIDSHTIYDENPTGSWAELALKPYQAWLPVMESAILDAQTFRRIRRHAKKLAENIALTEQRHSYI